jgi:SnoaL-like domain
MVGPAPRGAVPSTRAVEGTVEQEVCWLLDRARILELTARYNRCFDEGDVEGFLETFTDDGVMEVEGLFTATGSKALGDMVRHTPWGTMHVTTDATVEVDGDHAIQVVTLVVLARKGSKEEATEERPKLVGTGHYVDDVVRTGGGWRFQKRYVTLDGRSPK